MEEYLPVLVRRGKDDLNWIWRNRHKPKLRGLLIKYFYSNNFCRYSRRLTLKNRNEVKKIRRMMKKYCKDGKQRKMKNIFNVSNISEIRFVLSNYIIK